MASMSPPPVADIRLMMPKILSLALAGLDQHIAACIEIPNKVKDVSSVSFNYSESWFWSMCISRLSHTSHLP